MRLDYSRIFGIGLVFLLLFFLFNTFFDYIKINSHISKVSYDLSKLKSEKYFLSKNIERFSGPEIDFDLLETQCRSILAMVNGNENVFFWKDVPGEDLDVYNG